MSCCVAQPDPERCSAGQTSRRLQLRYRCGSPPFPFLHTRSGPGLENRHCLWKTTSRRSGPEASASQTQVLFRFSTDFALPQEPESESRDRASLVLRCSEDRRRPRCENDHSTLEPPVKNRLSYFRGNNVPPHNDTDEQKE